jgi:O-antigen/teichoic acid export membrane protein
MLMPGAVCFAAFKLLNVNLAGQGKPWLTLVAILPALALNMLLGYVLVPLFGSVGAAQATSVSYVVGAGVMVMIYCRSSGQSLRETLICTTADIRLLCRALPGMLGRATG